MPGAETLPGAVVSDIGSEPAARRDRAFFVSGRAQGSSTMKRTGPGAHAPSEEGRTVSAGKAPAAFSIPEFCVAHAVGRTTVYQQIAAGALKPRKIGRRTIITAEEARRWLDSLPEGG